MNGYTFRESNSVIYIVASHMNWDHLIKEKLCAGRCKVSKYLENSLSVTDEKTVYLSQIKNSLYLS